MFFCNQCAERKKWPMSIFTSHGRCEICGKIAYCNDVPSNRLPEEKR